MNLSYNSLSGQNNEIAIEVLKDAMPYSQPDFYRAV